MYFYRFKAFISLWKFGDNDKISNFLENLHIVTCSVPIFIRVEKINRLNK